jgi:putative addiction module component (TIGR02574 family)
MATLLEELVQRALRLSPEARRQLIHRLMASLEGESEDTPEAIAQAWDEEIARRVADMEAGCVQWIPGDEVMARIHAKISAAKDDAEQS